MPIAAPSAPRGRRYGSSGGPSGTGKSRWVAATWPDAFWKSPESKWWDGYSGQETVVLDDFKDYAMPLVELQRLLDWYPLGRGQGGERAHAGQEVCPHGEHVARGLVPQGRCPPHDMAPCDRLCGQARAPDQLINCVDGWTPLRPGLGAEVPGNTEPQGQEPQPALGEDIVQAIASWRCD